MAASMSMTALSSSLQNSASRFKQAAAKAFFRAPPPLSARMPLPSPVVRTMGRQSLSSSSSSSLFGPPVLTLHPTPATSTPTPNSRHQPLQTFAKAGYKLKTHKASAKRFRVTGSGKVVRRNAWRAHLLRKKSTKRKNRLAGMSDVFRGDLDKIVGALPYLKVKRVRLAVRPSVSQAGKEEEEEEEGSSKQ